MSIQEKVYTQKKTGKTIKKYYAAVWDPQQKKLISGKLRERKKEAVADEAEIIKQIESGAVPTSQHKNITVTDAYNVWIEAIRPQYANSTYQIYKYYYSHFIEPVFGSERVKIIQTIHIQRFVNEMNKKYSPETVNKIINILSVLFRFCVEVLKCIPSSPVEGIKRAKVELKSKPTWTSEQISNFINYDKVKQSHYYPMILISFFLGSRPGEICGLAESDFHQKEQALTLTRGYDRYGVLSDMKNKNSHRLLPLPPIVASTINKHLLYKKKMRLVDRNFADNDFLFVSELGNPILPDTYSHAFKDLVTSYNKEAKEPLPEISLYGCRHSFATNNLLNESVSPKLVSSIMGNSVKTVLTNYAHVSQDMQKTVVDNYADSLKHKEA